VAGLCAALPMKLHLDAVVAVGVHGRVGAQAHHQRGLQAMHAGLGLAQTLGGAGGAVGHADALSAQLALVQGLGAVIAKAGQGHRAQALRQAGLFIGTQVVARGVGHAQHDESVAIGMAGVFVQCEGAAWAQGAHGAFAIEALALRLQGLHLHGGQALGVFGGFVGVGARLVHVAQGYGLVVRGIAQAVAGVVAHAAVIPAGSAEFSRCHLPVGMPVPQAVALQHGRGLGEAHGLQGAGRVGLKGARVVGQHQGVVAQAGLARLACVFKPGVQAFFSPQALQEGQVGLGVLHAQ